MKIGDLSASQVMARATTTGLRYRTGPFAVCLYSPLPDFLDTLHKGYAGAPLLEQNSVCHFRIAVRPVSGIRRWLRPQVQFFVDGICPFEPYPTDHAFPLYEWGLNWCIGSAAHNYLILHSAVVEKEGKALIMPALPGSGKSTLCAGLVARGWRLLSDEFGIVRPADGLLLPLPRAAPLKNESIDIIQRFAPDLPLGPLFEKTRKGTVRHVMPPGAALGRQDECVRPRWVVFPKYIAGAAASLEPFDKHTAFIRLSNNSFNYQLTQRQGFDTLLDLVRRVDCLALENGDLEQAVAAVESLFEADAA